jgi:LacI family transcriptional regulator
MKQVALLIESSNAYACGLLRSIVAYMREHRPWSLYLEEHSRVDQPPSWLRGWRGDGILEENGGDSLGSLRTMQSASHSGSG